MINDLIIKGIRFLFSGVVYYPMIAFFIVGFTVLFINLHPHPSNYETGYIVMAIFLMLILSVFWPVTIFVGLGLLLTGYIYEAFECHKKCKTIDLNDF